MKITGYKLKELIKQAEMVRDTVASHFDDSLHKFEGDATKATPQEIVDKFRRADLALAQIQAVQAQYNLAVEVTVLGEKMTLLDAVKRVGGAGRIEKMWRSASGTKKDRYAYRDELTRDKDTIRAKRTISKGAALELAQQAAKVAGALRAAIAEGNSREVELDVSLPDLV